MRRAFLLAVLAAAGAAPLATPLLAQTPAAQDGAYRAEFLSELKTREDKYLGLAEAIPAGTYTWRPAEGVRSVSEVLLHIAAANYNFAGRLGATPPASFDPQGWETSTTDKAAITEEVRRSFEHLRQAVERSTNPEEATIPWFGGTTITNRAFYQFLTGHAGEHLGQLIAYARVNGVRPPWSGEG